MRKWLLIGFLCLLLGWSLPAAAASSVNPKLEQQVLQILREHPEVIIESVQIFEQQQQQKLQKTRQAFLQDLKTNTQLVIAESPTIGSLQSKIVLVEFSDFQCPYCAEAHKTLKQLLAKYPDKFTLVYKHFPLMPIHDQALPAAKAAWAAYQQGKFWEYHDALFTHQQKLGEELYLSTAKSLNLDVEKFQADAFGANSIAEQAIRKDIQLAEKLGLGGTPFFIMNSNNFSGVVQLSNIESILANAT
ncbi:DsbA family protein [Tolypothrix sp. PCC 7910]|uniref:DsbA family protein n=1 Tax=Tolypothrix sp. PCC 7910 TaxID=2099387 RepID=UPI003530191D